MKKSDLEQVISDLKELKTITDSQQYLVSRPANQLYNKILPILDKELDRLKSTNTEVNCPAILVFSIPTDKKTSITDFINTELHKLVLKDYKILDYDIKTVNNEDAVVIKYTN